MVRVFESVGLVNYVPTNADTVIVDMLSTYFAAGTE